MKIKDMSAGERPREKMISRGAAALSDGELIAVIIRGGSSRESAVDLARRIIRIAGGRLSGLAGLTADELMGLPGVGECKAASLMAAIELGRRFVSDKSGLERKSITTAKMVYDLMLPLYKGLAHEECWVLFLDNRNHVTAKQKMSSGGSDMTTIDVRQIVRRALEKGAPGIILTHNHPAGDPHPSEADIRQTEALHNAASACSIALVDHVVISDDTFFSFSENE